MRRRDLACSTAALWLATRTPARAQGTRGLPRIARLSTESPLAENLGPNPIHAFTRAFIHGLRDLGWFDGRNIVIEHRSAEGRPERLPALLREVVDLQVDIIVTAGSQAALAARRATGTIPIVSVGPNLVTLGLAASVARPGGNVTGLSFDTGTALLGKRLEWLQRIVPSVRRVAYLRQRTPATSPAFQVETAAAVRSLGIELTIVEVNGPEDFDAAFAAMSRHRPDAISGADSPLNIGNRARIIEFARREGLPMVFGLRQFAEAGALLSYGIDIPELERRAARYVDKILKGAKPGELPIELPTRFELVINQKAAAALGVRLPDDLLLLADAVIQ